MDTVQAGLGSLRGRLRPIATMDHACVDVKSLRGGCTGTGLAWQGISIAASSLLLSSHCYSAHAETHATRERCTVIVPSSGILDFQQHFEFYAQVLQEGLAG